MSESCIHEVEETEVQEPRKRGLFRRGEDGLTTLEWLLIVAAVAGLAALAVVLVQNVVDQTAEQIGGSSARETAAKVAASNIEQKAKDDPPAWTTDLTTSTPDWNTKQREYQQDCERLEITYGDVDGLKVDWTNLVAGGATQTAFETKWISELDDAAKGCVIGS